MSDNNNNKLNNNNNNNNNEFNNNNNEDNKEEKDENQLNITLYNMAAFPSPAYKFNLYFDKTKDTIETLREKVSKNTLYNPSVFDLIWKGKKLEGGNNDSITSLNYEKGMIIIHRKKGTRNTDFPTTNVPQREVSIRDYAKPSNGNSVSYFRSNFSINWGNRAENDAKIYREGYPEKKDDLCINSNIDFYSNKIPSMPSGDFIDNIHKKWWGDYEKLEVHHGYVQWLFPIREHGLNAQANPLQLHEIEKMKNDQKIIKRAKNSYAMMLDFWGMKLEDEDTGKVVRDKNNEKRYLNLNHSGHNYLRITRILKFLGEIGLEHFKKPFCEFVIQEIFEQGYLKNCYESLKNYWIPVLRIDKEREEILEILKQKGKVQRDPFTWINLGEEEDTRKKAKEEKDENKN